MAEFTFQHGEAFAPGEVSAGLGLGPLEEHYGELFAEALEDGVITAEERATLERAADNLGINPERLLKLEKAMVAAHEMRHRVRIVEHHEEPVPSLSPLQVEAGGDPGRVLLLKRIEQLEVRVAELEEELTRAEANVNVEVDLSELSSFAEQAREDEGECWRRVRHNPSDRNALRDLLNIYSARGDEDRAWCISQSLVLLGAANETEKNLFEKHRPQTLVSLRTSVSPAAWYELLAHPEQEPLVGQLLAVVTPAALLGRATALRRDNNLHRPPEEAKQDPNKSTVSAVRAVSWAAAALGIATPGMYVEAERDVGYEHVPGVPPVTVIGRGVLSGRSQLEHAFLAGRHLSYYRQDQFLKVLFTSVADLEDIFLAALSIGNPGLPMTDDVRARVGPVAQAIEPVLEPSQRDALRGLFLRFVEEGGRTNLQRWSQAVEKTCCRAGFLLSNDLLTATQVLSAQEGALGSLAQDLIVFSTSERYFSLRRQLGIVVE